MDFKSWMSRVQREANPALSMRGWLSKVEKVDRGQPAFV